MLISRLKRFGIRHMNVLLRPISYATVYGGLIASSLNVTPELSQEEQQKETDSYYESGILWYPYNR